MTFSSLPNWVAEKSCVRLLPSIWRVNWILFLIRPPAFLARVGRQSFSSGHFILLAKLMSMQLIMAPLSTRAMVLALFPPFVGWRVRGMVIPHSVMVFLPVGDDL